MNQNVDKAVRLFRFLSEFQKLSETSVLTTDQYARDGQVLKLASLVDFVKSGTPELALSNDLAESVDLATTQTTSFTLTNGELVRFARAKNTPFPKLNEADLPWVSNFQQSRSMKPDVRKTISVQGRTLQFDDLEDVQKKRIANSLDAFEKWAENEKYKDLYQKAFEIHTSFQNQSDEFELVLGFLNLSWQLPNLGVIDRNIFTTKLISTMDKRTGSILFALDDSELQPELEMIPPEEIQDQEFVSNIQEAAGRISGSLLRANTFVELGNVAAVCLHLTATYEASMQSEKAGPSPRITWKPTILLRKRRKLGLSGAFANISKEILESESIPKGLVSLVDPNFEALVTGSATDGATFTVDDEVFLPLPLNRKQEAVLQRVDTHPHTIVQGPPGTGKTHMAAALLSHLLAQGKRVLVTAQTERALYELRGKMPKEVRELAVSVVSGGKEDLTELRKAIDNIKRRSSSFDPAEAQAGIRDKEARLNRLRQERIAATRALAKANEYEAKSLGLRGFEGYSLAEALEKWDLEKSRFDWIESIDIDFNKAFPLSSTEITELFDLLDDGSLASDRNLESADKVDLRRFPTPQVFAAACQAFQEAVQAEREATKQVNSASLQRWLALTESERSKVEQAAVCSMELQGSLENSDVPWAAEILHDATASNLDKWIANISSSQEKVSLLDELVLNLGTVRRFVLPDEFDRHCYTADKLSEYLLSGGALKTRADGSVKTSLFTSSTVKDSMPFFDEVRINGVPPTTLEGIRQYQHIVEFFWGAEGLWKQGFGTAKEFINLQFSTELADLRNCVDSAQDALEMGKKLANCREELKQLGFGDEFGTSQELVLLISALKAIVEAKHALDVANNDIQEVRESIRRACGPNDNPWIKKIQAASERRAPDQYDSTLREIKTASKSSAAARRRNSLLCTLAGWSQKVADGIVSSDSSTWRARLVEAPKALDWVLSGKHIHAEKPYDFEALQRRIHSIDKDITETITALAADRAWSASLGPDRIDGSMRAHLGGYTEAVGRLGKGTGKHANRHRRDVRKHLDACRSAVPVWIMPIYKVVEQFQLKQDMFDVVVVDEASQAGASAIFLQYLAPRIVVIGDDKQVSPLAVGSKLDQYEKLANQYLYDFDFKDAWADPKRSLFADADMRYGGRIVLDEHRRCVPEIIEYSNQLVYRPNNIELKPVRQVESDRLAPFRITHTPNAYVRGKFNPVEATVLVNRLKSAIDDPNYDGKSFGVIVLMSSDDQVTHIQKLLLEQLSPSVWEDRDLKVGKPADFQGAERDVIFLSMTWASQSDKRATLVSDPKFEQRFNVAVSRAKDQVWLFHSISRSDLPNPEDLRANLLDYAYSVANSRPELRRSSQVSEDERVEPFDSLFEQRVYNALVARGYYVVPQKEEFGYRIDLVVEGSHVRLAVECDGDHWHGDDAALKDQARQRQLERLGWKFCRLFESDFYLDRQGSINKIIEHLEWAGVEPYSEYASSVESDDSNIEVLDSIVELETNSVDDPTVSDQDLGDKADALLAPMPEERVVGSSPSRTRVEDPSDYMDSYSFHESPYALDDVESEAEEGNPANEILGDSIQSPETKEIHLEPYNEFSGKTVAIQMASDSEVRSGLLEILNAEGPMTGTVLMARYNNAGGGRRLAKAMKSKLRKSLDGLVQDNSVICQTADTGMDWQDRTFRLPDQKNVLLRELGPRDLYQIPFEELQQVVEQVFKNYPGVPDRTLMRIVLDTLGLSNLTEKAESKLRSHLVRCK